MFCAHISYPTLDTGFEVDEMVGVRDDLKNGAAFSYVDVWVLIFLSSEALLTCALSVVFYGHKPTLSEGSNIKLQDYSYPASLTLLCVSVLYRHVGDIDSVTSSRNSENDS